MQSVWLLAQIDQRGWTIITIVAVLIALVILLVIIAAMGRFFRLWIQSYSTSAGIGLFDLVGMYLRNVNPDVIVRSKIMAVQAGMGDSTGITTRALEAHYMARGNVPKVIRALIAANKAKTIDLGYKLATAIDLAGRDVLEAVQTSVYPKVIDCPARGSQRDSLDAISKDGIQLKVKARVTVRTNLQQLIGGATEETIIARVGEGILTAIGSCENYADVLENPDVISKTVLARRLDAQTAFEIVSIDIADIDVGENVGAKLQADKAEADMRQARARAEGLRAMNVAAEQEMIAAIESSRAKLVEAEAEVPAAIAEAFETGKLAVLDFYKMKNIQADTDMRKSIAGAGPAVSEITQKPTS